MLKGIDVSYVQGKIDWEKVKDNIDFAILRCGYGQDKASQDDSQFQRNVSECERLGIPYGVYLYSYADSIEKAASEADHVLRLIKGRKLSYPVYYDLEDANTTGKCSNETIAAIAKVFCDKIEQAGYWAGIYANLYWWMNKLTDQIFSKWVKWVAQYHTECTYQGTYGMWQHTSSGRMDGISTKVDMDICYDNYPEKILGKVVTPAPKPQPALKTYTVQKGDTLSGIAAKHGISLTRIKQLNPQITNPNLIYAGQLVYVEGTVSSPEPAPAVPKTPYKGQKVSLNNVPLYGSASTQVACGKVKGTYYLWDGVLVNGRYRITNAASRVGVAGQVTGFIDKKYI